MISMQSESQTVNVLFLMPPAHLELAQNTVHYPVDRRSAHAGTFTHAQPLQVSDDRGYDGQLYVGRIRDVDVARALAGDKPDGFVGVDAERQRALIAGHHDAVGFGTFVTHKAPGRTAGDAAVEDESGTDGVFSLIEMFAVGGIAMGPYHDAEQLFEQVELVRSQIVEIAAAGDVGL